MAATIGSQGGRGMGAAVTITRTEHDAASLRAATAKTSDGAQVRRLLAWALVMEGWSRKAAAELNGMDRQTLSDWVHRYNVEGIGGLKSRKSPGRAPFLSEQQMAELRDLVLAGPDPAIKGGPLAMLRFADGGGAAVVSRRACQHDRHLVGQA